MQKQNVECRMGEAMQVTKIADNLLLLVGSTYHSNSLVFLRNREALLVEAMGSLADGDSLRQYV